MGCNFSSQPVKVVNCHEPEISDKTDIETSDREKRSSVTKSHDSFLSSNGSIESDKITVSSGSEILAPHRSKSVDLSRNGSANRDDPPVATATIIRGPSATMRQKNNKLDIPLPHQPDTVSIHSEIISNSPRIEHRSKKSVLQKRRSSDGDIGKVTNVTCIPTSLIKANHLLNTSFPRVQPLNFGPRNSRRTLTDSQKDFFRMLDEKVAEGKDYCSSEDERSLASFRSLSIHRNDSAEFNHGFAMGQTLHVR